MRIGKSEFRVEWWNQLGAFLPWNWGRWNWYDIYWLHLSTEYSSYKGSSFEVQVAVVGLGLTVEFVKDVPAREKWAESIMDGIETKDLQAKD